MTDSADRPAALPASRKRKPADDFPALVIPYHGELLAGIDEVGRGPLVGPVVAAAVILDPNDPIVGITDSKKLSEKKRLALYEQIRARAWAWAIAEATSEEIDELNIYQATHLAMRRAIDALGVRPEYLLVDGNRLPGHEIPGMAVVKGDLRHAAIGAASILAKVYRDAQMAALDACFPAYGFARHKGYPTREHQAAIETHGILTLHRKSFGPVKRLYMAGHVPQAVPEDALIALPAPVEPAAEPDKAVESSGQSSGPSERSSGPAEQEAALSTSEPSQSPAAKKPPAVV